MNCCFIGHRIIKNKEKLFSAVKEKVEGLIKNDGFDTFFFGSVGQFNNLCLEIVTELQNEYRHIKRIYVRAEYQNISTDYEKYILESYDETYFPKKVIKAGKLAYVLRNEEMIDKSYICIFYCNKNYTPPSKIKTKPFCKETKSGTELALTYAKKRINI